jgi:hypothetical protein
MHALMSLHSCPSMARVLALDALAYRLGRDELCGLASNSCSLQSRTAQCAPPHCHGGDHGHVQTVRACYISVHAWVADSHCHVRPLRALAMWERGGPAGRGGGGRAAGASRLRVLRERERREGCECGECVNVGNPDPARGAWCCGVPNLIRGIQHACRVPGEREPNRYKRVFDVLAWVDMGRR